MIWRTTSLSAAALAPTAASAKPFGFGGNFGLHRHPFGFAAPIDDACLVRQLFLTPFGYQVRLVNISY